MKRILFACLFLVACATDSGTPPPPTSGEDTGAVDDLGEAEDADLPPPPEYPECPCILECMAEVEMATIPVDLVSSSSLGRCINNTCGGGLLQSEAIDCCVEATVEQACETSADPDCDDWFEFVCVDASNGDDAMDDAAETSPDPDETGADESGGDLCEMHAEYNCRGTAIGLYYNAAAGDLDPDNTAGWTYMPIGGDYPDESTVGCIETTICVPYMGDQANPPQNAPIYNHCQAECETQSHPWPGTHPGNSNYEFTGYTACVFGVSGPWGVPDDTYCTDLDEDGVYEEEGECVTITHNPGASYGDECDSTGSTQQIDYVDECENKTCEDAVCGSWPGHTITSSFNAVTKTYTTSISSGFLSSLLAGGFNKLYRCDDGFWTMYGTGAAETWKMNGLMAGDVLYKMGFRSNDKDLKVRVNLSGATLYPMYATFGPGGNDGWVNQMIAYNALSPFSSWVFEWKRQVSGTWVTHKMVLTAS